MAKPPLKKTRKAATNAPRRIKRRGKTTITVKGGGMVRKAMARIEKQVAAALPAALKKSLEGARVDALFPGKKIKIRKAATNARAGDEWRMTTKVGPLSERAMQIIEVPRGALRLPRWPGKASAPSRRGKLAWAVVHKGGRIEVETVSETAGRCRDNLNTMDEEQGAKVRRVRVVPAWQ